MVKEYGMSAKVGQVYFAREKRAQFLNIPVEGAIEYSEATAELIDTEVREIINNPLWDKISDDIDEDAEKHSGALFFIPIEHGFPFFEKRIRGLLNFLLELGNACSGDTQFFSKPVQQIPLVATHWHGGGVLHFSYGSF